MRALPLTMFGPLLPQIARSLGAGLAEIGWIVATYATGSLLAQPIMGRLSDTRGRKRMLIACIALFGAGSLICAVSTTLWILVAGRMVQALGAGGIAPIAAALVGDRIEQSHRGSALGLIYGAFGLGTMAGALLGGAVADGALWLTAHATLWTPLRSELASYPWHLVFWVNVVLAAIALLSARSLANDEPDQLARPQGNGIDAIGIAVVACFTLAIMGAATSGAITAIALLLTAGACLFFLAIWERRAKSPLFDPRLFAGRGPGLLYAIAFLFGIPSFSLTIYSATYYIAQFNASEMQSGLALFDLATAYVIGAICGGQAVRAVGAKVPLGAGLVLCSASLASMSTAQLQAFVLVAMIAGGLGLGLSSAPPNALILDYFDSARRGAATGVATMLATSGSITAPAAASAFLHYGTGDAAANLRGDFLLGAVLAGACALLAAFLPRGKTMGSFEAGQTQ